MDQVRPRKRVFANQPNRNARKHTLVAYSQGEKWICHVQTIGHSYDFRHRKVTGKSE